MNIQPQLRTPGLTPDTLSRIAKQIYEIAGIHLQSEKLPLVEARLAKRLRSLGLSSYEDYCDLLEQENQKDEKKHLLSSLTTNVTKFFRENHHFEYLKENDLQYLIEKARKGQAVRFWSAGCSSGEEPYSLAMTILQEYPDAKELDVKILATDIDPQILLTARAGEYTRELITGIPSKTLSAFFSPETEGRLRVCDDVKSMITFNTLNLHDAWPIKTKFDVIFCRNVTIYFNKTDEQNVWRKFSNTLKDGGIIFTGHSERIPASSAPTLELCGITTYRKSKKAGDIHVS